MDDIDLPDDIRELGDAIDGYIVRAVTPLLEKMKALEDRLVAVEKGSHGAFRYRQIWSEDESYAPGDFVTLAGSMWACIRETHDRPGSPDSGWRLCVKAGARAKDHDTETAN